MATPKHHLLQEAFPTLVQPSSIGERCPGAIPQSTCFICLSNIYCTLLYITDAPLTYKNINPMSKAHHLPSTVLGVVLFPMARLSFSPLFSVVSSFGHNRFSANIRHTELKCMKSEGYPLKPIIKAAFQGEDH